MRIGIDARIASYNNSGISRYFWGLLDGLSHSDADFEAVIFFSRKKRFSLNLDSRFTVRYLFTPPHNPLEKLILPFELAAANCSVLHAMDFYIPSLPELPQILSVYDIYFLKEPESLDPSSYEHYRRVKRYAESAAHVICSSEATKKDLLEVTHVKPGRVSVVYPGLSIPEVPPVLPSRALPERFMLFVGTIEPRKNIERLLRAILLAKSKSSSALPHLLLVGRKGFRSNVILDSISALGLDADVTYLGELPDAEVHALYRAAEFVVYPSLYEGFGFPLLEAMYSDTPVLSSNISSIPEVAGDAAYLVDPESTESIAAGMLALSSNEDLRRELIAKGQKRRECFSWGRAAAETIEIYRRAVGGA